MRTQPVVMLSAFCSTPSGRIWAVGMAQCTALLLSGQVRGSVRHSRALRRPQWLNEQLPRITDSGGRERKTSLMIMRRSHLRQRCPRPWVRSNHP